MPPQTFTKAVSKGTRFNQIYIPSAMHNTFEVGDVVEVQLIRKRQQLSCSRNLVLSSFKEELIKKIFAVLETKDISQIFIVGSYLRNDVVARDIDIVVITPAQLTAEKLTSSLERELGLHVHLLVMHPQKWHQLLRICPLTRCMFRVYATNRPFDPAPLMQERSIDKNHLFFLLMMPEDILELGVESRVFYDSLRRVFTIEAFLWDNETGIQGIEEKIAGQLSPLVFTKLKTNQILTFAERNDTVSLLRKKIKQVKEAISNGQA
ncbi:nucleotidyltransferase domain-containing protein [Candidatus Woesearchaeota archaeon]|nr:nucleotidyltransferase domain-containing protein [Candidatus Woesearchaeota archaeon]